MIISVSGKSLAVYWAVAIHYGIAIISFSSAATIASWEFRECVFVNLGADIVHGSGIITMKSKASHYFPFLVVVA